MKVSKDKTRRMRPDLVERPEDLDTGEIVDGEPAEDIRITGLDLSGRSIRQLEVRRSLVEAVSFAAANLQSVRLRDVRLIRCDLSNCLMHRLEAIRVEFVDCRLMGMKAIECRMEDVLLERCDARYAQFHSGAARRSEFIDAQLQEADFRGANLENTVWVRSSLARADLTGAKLAGADLRGADIDGMTVGMADVAGAMVTPSQAMDLARLLGVVIR